MFYVAVSKLLKHSKSATDIRIIIITGWSYYQAISVMIKKMHQAQIGLKLMIQVKYAWDYTMPAADSSMKCSFMTPKRVFVSWSSTHRFVFIVPTIATLLIQPTQYQKLIICVIASLKQS